METEVRSLIKKAGEMSHDQLLDAFEHESVNGANGEKTKLILLFPPNQEF